MAPKHRGHKVTFRETPKPATQEQEPLDEDDDLQDLDQLNYSQMSSLDVDDFEESLFNQTQRDEYIAIASVYGDGEKKVERIHGRRDPWKGFDNLAYKVTLVSYTNNDFTAKIDVEYPFDYPKVPLKVKLLSLQPLQNSSLEAAILDTLAKVPKQQFFNGSDSVYESAVTIAEAVITLLDEAADSYESGKEIKSLLEVRQAETALLRDHEQAEHERLLAQREEEAMQREEELKAALRREKMRRHIPGPVTAEQLQIHEDGMRERQDPNDSEEIVTEIAFRFANWISVWDPTEKAMLQFKSVFGPFDLVNRPDKKVTIVAPVKFGKMRRNVRLLFKQIFIPDSILSRDEMQVSMDEIRRVLEDCMQNEYEHLVKIFAYQIDHDTEDPEMSEWKISILTDFSADGSIFKALQISDGFRAGRVRQYGTEMLKGIEFLQRLGHIHPAVHTNNMLVFYDEEKKQAQIKLSDGYGTKLWQLVQKTRKAKNTAVIRNSGWVPPELLKDPVEMSNKTCSWEVGFCIVQMAFIKGHNVENVLTSPTQLTDRIDLDAHFLDVLKSCFEPLLRRRPATFDLATFPFFKDGEKFINIPTENNPGMEPHLLRSGIAGSMASIWQTRWRQSHQLGAGGFGQVIKAWSLNDAHYYAVKRLLCATPKDAADIWAEVRLLARLDHPGIVRYFHTWTEPESNEDDQTESTPSNTVDSRPVLSVRPRAISQVEPVSTGHDYMEPSLHRNIGPEFDSDSDDEDDNLFGYQSHPAGDDDDEDDENDEDNATPGERLDDADDDLLRQPTIDFDDDQDVMFEELSSNAFESPTRASENESSPVREARPTILPGRSLLFIQMELCESKTLADLIKAGLPYRRSQVWRLLREMLRALEHVHHHGVVHRDLKPANIFIDANGRSKLGDFGLAVTGQTQNVIRVQNHKAEQLTIAPTSLGIGTRYYTAPELEVGGSGRYSSKADMFSLGVIFYQMCYPMTTDTERVSNLRRISQEPNFQLPAYFEEENHQAEAVIIRKLINHDPDARPSAKELLDGDYLPEEIDQGALIRIMRKLRAEDPEEFDREWAPVKPAKDVQHTHAQELAYLPKGRKPTSRASPRVVVHISRQIEEIFERHGAVPSERDLPLPVQPFYPIAATFYDEYRMKIQLPWDLTIPFAAIIAEEAPEDPRNYCFGTVYRSRGTDQRMPEIMAEIAYDHVSYSARDLSRKDAEVISVLDEVFVELLMFETRRFVIYINHGDLLNLILEFCKVPDGSKDATIEVLSHLHSRGNTWKSTRSALLRPSMRLNERIVATIGEFNIQGSFQEVQTKVNAVFGDEFSTRAERPWNRMREIFNYLDTLEVLTPVLVSPLSNQSQKLYGGSTMYQCVDVKTGHIAAQGGRYDKLIDYYRNPEDPPTHTRAVGFRLNTIFFGEIAQQFYVKSFNRRPKQRQTGVALLPAQFDVIVTSFDEGTLNSACFHIAKLLFKAKIKTEVSEHYSTMEQLDAAYGDPIRYWLVIVRPGHSNRSKIKLRSPEREEREIRVTDLVETIKAELGGKAATPAPTPKLRKTWSGQGGGDSLAGGAPILLIPQHRAKKVNRMAVADQATTAAQRLAGDIGSLAPIVAFAPQSDAVLQGLRNTRMGDSDSWRSYRQLVPLEDKMYVQELQGTLEELVSSGKEGAFIVNYLTNSCIYYDLCKRS